MNQLLHYSHAKQGLDKGESFLVVILNIYIWSKILLSLKYDGLNYIHNPGAEFVDDIEVAVFFSKLRLLLYADDTVILAETLSDLQVPLLLTAWQNIVKTVNSTNVTKTQVMIFSRGKIRNQNKCILKKQNWSIYRQLYIPGYYNYLITTVNFG